MTAMTVWFGRLCGAVGAAFCVAAFSARITGNYWLGGFQVGTLLQAGIAGMTLGCLCLLWVLVDRPSRF